jgi:hypothetical protein
MQPLIQHTLHTLNLPNMFHLPYDRPLQHVVVARDVSLETIGELRSAIKDLFVDATGEASLHGVLPSF